MHGLRIERPLRADLESAYTVLAKSIAQAFEEEGISEAEALDEIAYKQALLRQSVEDDSETVFLVAKLNGQVVGTISFGPCGDDVRSCTNNELAEVGELGSIYVLPELQGKGVGSALIAAMANRLHKSGIEQFCLDCGLKAAQEKWKRKFGAPCIVAKDYWGAGSDHLIWLCNVPDFLC